GLSEQVAQERARPRGLAYALRERLALLTDEVPADGFGTLGEQGGRSEQDLTPGRCRGRRPAGQRRTRSGGGRLEVLGGGRGDVGHDLVGAVRIAILSARQLGDPLVSDAMGQQRWTHDGMVVRWTDPEPDTGEGAAAARAPSRHGKAQRGHRGAPRARW